MAAAPREEERSILVPRKEKHAWAMTLSIGVHGLILVGLVAGSLFPSCQGSAPPNQKPIAAKLVRLGTPRNENHLPRIPTAPPAPRTAKEAPVVTPGEKVAKPEPPTPPAPTPAPTPTPTPAPSTAPSTAKPAAAQAEAPKTPDSKERLDDIMKRFAAGSRTGKAEDLPGQLDGDPLGDAERAAEGERYLALVEQRIKAHYVVPSAIPDAERIRLSAVVRLRVERNGRISSYEITQPSGNGLYDSALEAAVQRASPLPPPPEHLLPMLRNLPVHFRI